MAKTKTKKIKTKKVVSKAKKVVKPKIKRSLKKEKVLVRKKKLTKKKVSIKKSPSKTIYKKDKSPIGGMAFTHGVMMRSKNFMSIAFRDDNKVEVVNLKVHNIRDDYTYLFIPFIRGYTYLIENICIVLKVWRNRNRFLKKKLKREKIHHRAYYHLSRYISYFFYLLIAMGFINYFYIKLVNLTPPVTLYGFFIGSVFSFFTLSFLSLLFIMIAFTKKDEVDFLAYHGAEHQVVNKFEGKKGGFIHDRCTLTVVFWTLVILSMFLNIFSLIGNSPIEFIVVTISMILFSYSLAYELVRFSAIGKKPFFYEIFIYPLLLLQYILATKPDKEHLEVADIALKNIVKMG